MRVPQAVRSPPGLGNFNGAGAPSNSLPQASGTSLEGLQTSAFLENPGVAGQSLTATPLPRLHPPGPHGAWSQGGLEHSRAAPGPHSSGISPCGGVLEPPAVTGTGAAPVRSQPTPQTATKGTALSSEMRLPLSPYPPEHNATFPPRATVQPGGSTSFSSPLPVRGGAWNAPLTMQPGQLAEAVHGFAHAQHLPSSRWLADCLAASEAHARAHAYTPQQLCMVVWGLARMRQLWAMRPVASIQPPRPIPSSASWASPSLSSVRGGEMQGPAGAGAAWTPPQSRGTASGFHLPSSVPSVLLGAGARAAIPHPPTPEPSWTEAVCAAGLALITGYRPSPSSSGTLPLSPSPSPLTPQQPVYGQLPHGSASAIGSLHSHAQNSATPPLPSLHSPLPPLSPLPPPPPQAAPDLPPALAPNGQPSPQGLGMSQASAPPAFSAAPQPRGGKQARGVGHALGSKASKGWPPLIATLPWALVVLRCPPPPNWLPAWLAAAQPVLPKLGPQDCAQLLGAVVNMGHKPPSLWVSDVWPRSTSNL